MNNLKALNRVSDAIIQAVIDNFGAVLEENDRLRKQIAAGSTSSASNKPKLSKRDVEMMRSLSRLGATNKELSVAYDVHHATVSRIIRGVYHR